VVSWVIFFAIFVCQKKIRKKYTQRHPRHNFCAIVSGVTKDAGPASCAVVASQWAGGAVRENKVLFSVFFTLGTGMSVS
jgi:hypothetical protein